jgi:hypothetical protein
MTVFKQRARMCGHRISFPANVTVENVITTTNLWYRVLLEKLVVA